MADEESIPLLRSFDAQTILDRVADDARAAVGTGSTGPAERQDAYGLRLFPNTPDARKRAQMADALYSCGLNGLAAMRAAYVEAPEAYLDYSKHFGQILDWLGNIARRFGAYVDLQTRAACEAALPYIRAGEILVVDNPVHVIVLTDKADPLDESELTRYDFDTSEGGMLEVDEKTGEKGMCIHKRRMRLRLTPGGRIQTGTVHDDGTVTWGRIAIYLIACGSLRTTDGL